MKPLTPEYRGEIDKLHVTIPKLVLDGCQDWESMTSKFMWALDSNFPPVADKVYVKVTNIHARWVRSLVYPHEWESIRAFLSLFSGFHVDGTARSWVETDLRLVDVFKLSRMAVLGIEEIFRV
ncbi:uncharacterized protein LOC129589714 [Paramacrobiotus metropolitanus]|uniref:uncharacterized protein LOC129589714 n=1 Tax=Paramacrobiotus metropolitanus TaxID=2943436 RepID=UPI00244595A5|nr:uncharacterized protein LOC129589714 [Paramacrobiotus metropolitanus]